MAVGGATWDDAGVLELGAGNTFDLADAIDAPPVYDPAWWTFTPDVPGLLSIEPDSEVGITVYRGTDADRIEVSARDSVGAFGETFLLTDGVEYHVLIWLGEFDTPPGSGTYQVTATMQEWATSPWLTDWQDRTDNQLIISGVGAVGESPSTSLQMENPVGWQYDPGDLSLAWYEQVVRMGVARRGSWQTGQVLGGDPVADGLDCCIAHARYGDQGIQQWNTPGSGTSTGPGVCATLPGPGPAEPESGAFTCSYASDIDDGGVLGLGISSADTKFASRGVWVRPIYDNVGPEGVLGIPAPEDFDIPSGAVVEWEDEHPELTGVEVANDWDQSLDPPPVHFDVNGPLLPTYGGGVWDVWQLGNPIGGTGGPPTTYDWPLDTDHPWHDLPEYGSWDDVTLDYENDSPDAVAGIIPQAVWDGWTGEVAEVQLYGDIAVRATLRSPRFRFVYVDDTPPTVSGAPPPRRIFQRSDASTYGARRVLGGGNTRQRGNRIFGSIL